MTKTLIVFLVVSITYPCKTGENPPNGSGDTVLILQEVLLRLCNNGQGHHSMEIISWTFLRQNL